MHIFMSERSDPGGRPGYGAGKICNNNNYADFHSRKAGSVPDPERKALVYRSESGKMSDPNPDLVPVPNLTLGVPLYTTCRYQCSGFGSTGSTFFAPPGSGSTSQRYGSGSGSFFHQAKIVRKTLTCFVTLLDVLSLKNDVNVPSKSTVISRKNLSFSISFLLAS
jgi:hypothetical protein